MVQKGTTSPIEQLNQEKYKTPLLGAGLVQKEDMHQRGVEGSRQRRGRRKTKITEAL
jgi:hypothetical protein